MLQDPCIALFQTLRFLLALPWEHSLQHGLFQLDQGRVVVEADISGRAEEGPGECSYCRKYLCVAPSCSFLCSFVAHYHFSQELEHHDGSRKCTKAGTQGGCRFHAAPQSKRCDSREVRTPYPSLKMQHIYGTMSRCPQAVCGVWDASQCSSLMIIDESMFLSLGSH